MGKVRGKDSAELAVAAAETVERPVNVIDGDVVYPEPPPVTVTSLTNSSFMGGGLALQPEEL